MSDDRKQFLRDGFSSTDIFTDLKERIVKGDLPGGSPLKQSELAAEFGVSKIPVREALRQLESGGLVEFRPRRGAIVAAPNASDIVDLLDVRLALECRALELAIPNLVEEELQTARKILQAYSTSSKVQTWSKLNARFHMTLYKPCDKPHLLAYIEDVKSRMGAYLALNVTRATGFDRPHREHLQLLNACESGDVKAALRILRKHIETTQREVLAFIRQKNQA